MPRAFMILAIFVLACTGMVASTGPASADGWQRRHHHRHHLHRHHHRGWVHHYGPSSRWAGVAAPGWLFGCGLRPFVTYYGSLAYREVCH